MFVDGFFILFAPDEGGGSSGGSGSGDGGEGSGGNTEGDKGKTDTGTDNSGKGDGGSSAGDKGKQDGEGDKGKKKVEFTPEQQAELDRIAGEARKQGRKAAQDEANNAKLKEEGKFKDLHEALEQEVETNLKPKAALADKLSKRINDTVTATVKGWPDALKKQDPGPDNVEARLDWFDRSQDLAKELLANKKAPDTESGGGSGGGSSKTAAQVVTGGFRKPGVKK
jgi:hypothetical protein